MIYRGIVKKASKGGRDYMRIEQHKGRGRWEFVAGGDLDCMQRDFLYADNRKAFDASRTVKPDGKTPFYYIGTESYLKQLQA